MICQTSRQHFLRQKLHICHFRTILLIFNGCYYRTYICNALFKKPNWWEINLHGLFAITMFGSFSGTPLNKIPECLYVGARLLSKFPWHCYFCNKESGVQIYIKRYHYLIEFMIMILKNNVCLLLLQHVLRNLKIIMIFIYRTEM